MEYLLCLQSTELNKKLDLIDMQMTIVRDQLSVLNAEAEKLAENWKGQAQTQWIKGFRSELTRLNQYAATVRKQERVLKSIVQLLILQEQSVETICNEI